MTRTTISRRKLFQMGAAAAATASLAGLPAPALAAPQHFSDPGPGDLVYVNIAELQYWMAS